MVEESGDDEADGEEVQVGGGHGFGDAGWGWSRSGCTEVDDADECHADGIAELLARGVEA